MTRTSTWPSIHDGLSSAGVLTDALPALLLLGGAAALALAFTIRNLALGPYHDRQVVSRGSTAIVGMWLRQCFVWGLRPIIGLLFWSRLPPAAVTTVALLLGIGSGAALATGRVTWGAALFIASGICDFLDGRLARQQGTAGPVGALLDSVVDRCVETVVFVGLAWYYRGTWVLATVLAAMAGSLLVPYVRARGEALGVAFSNVGLAQRPERFIILGASLLLSPIAERWMGHAESVLPHRVIVVGIVLVAITTSITALQRLLHAQHQLAGTDLKQPTLVSRGSLLHSALATAVDFGAVLLLAGPLRLHPAIATFAGCTLGAIANFSMNRLWAFRPQRTNIGMAARYSFASASSAALNTGLVLLLLQLPEIPFVALWWAVRALVHFLWSYRLHRDYVFADPTPGQTQPEEENRYLRIKQAVRTGNRA